mmetsp:Transcript_9512/g.14689  ORF Transcript_9512/g.14689 Transcript_9512/m.14689 type:complete len:189 (+) Transcript_9512:88-654(+)|eukprot:CAMPEP_0178913388 /NCGR_PEP_ID=MMETSP0786-20121207/10811_1 /TAXON_ID=186022 /ORGANISM="Thalassionema frauenfeldii, Strain CCMP 1798" /LENGTH=188 /DNA_ID=CAMNT_0020586117 /DNA_START=36 /DNA_END=602 /DNA_ORIENTATION=-
MASTSRRNNRYTGVGQQDDPSLRPPQPTIRQGLSTAQVLGALAIVWIVVRVLYVLPRFLDVLLGLAVVVSCLVVGRWKQQRTQSNETNSEERMERINREREETEATVHEAAQMMLDIDRQHLDEFIEKNNQSSTYEEWISELHPDNVQESGAIDHRFYVHDSDHRLMWNGKADGVYRHPVEAKTADLV